MSEAVQEPAAIAALFDLRRPASRDELLRLVGHEVFAQFYEPGKPFVVFILKGTSGQSGRFAFEQEDQLIDFYRASLKVNMQMRAHQRMQFVPRHLAPELMQRLLGAARDLALELVDPDDSA